MYKLTKLFIFLLSVLFSLNINGQAIKLAADITEGTSGTFDDDSDYENGIIGTIGKNVYLYAYKYSQKTYRVWSYNSESTLTKVLYENNSVEDLRNFFIHDNKLYFVADLETLYVIENDIPAKIVYESDDYIHSLTLFKSEVHFINDDRLKKVTNTGEIKEIYEFGFFGASTMKVLNDKLIIIGRDKENDDQLFTSDGTKLGTKPYFLLNAGSSFRSDFNMTLVDNKIFFWYSLESRFMDLFVTDGTNAGTKNLKRFKAFDFQDLVADKSIVSFKNKIYFRADTDTDGDNLYVSDGTSNGTKLFFNPNEDKTDDSRPKNMVVYKNKLYFSGINSFWNPSLYVTDGSTPTKVFSNFNYSGLYLTLFNDSLYFHGDKDDWNGELFSTIGTSAGTKQISRESDETAFSPYNLTAGSDLLFFIGKKKETGTELYYYNPKFTSNLVSTNLSNFQIYPNPVQESIKIKFEERLYENDFGIEIYDILGKVVIKLNSYTENIDIRNLSNGVYTLSLKYNNNNYSKLFIKE